MLSLYSMNLEPPEAFFMNIKCDRHMLRKINAIANVEDISYGNNHSQS